MYTCVSVCACVRAYVCLCVLLFVVFCSTCIKTTSGAVHPVLKSRFYLLVRMIAFLFLDLALLECNDLSDPYNNYASTDTPPQKKNDRTKRYMVYKTRFGGW